MPEYEMTEEGYEELMKRYNASFDEDNLMDMEEMTEEVIKAFNNVKNGEWKEFDDIDECMKWLNNYQPDGDAGAIEILKSKLKGEKAIPLDMDDLRRRAHNIIKRETHDA